MRKGMIENYVLVVSTGVFIVSLLLIILQNPELGSITGHVTEATTTSNVTISKYLSISMSSNLTRGIMFGNVTSLPAYDINGTSNFDGGSSSTTYYLNVSQDSNTRVDFCIRTNDDLYDSVGGNRIAIGNETYSNYTSSDIDNPSLASARALNKTGYVKAGQNISQGGNIFYRFYLDIPSGTSSGTYNNTIYFEGVELNQAC